MNLALHALPVLPPPLQLDTCVAAHPVLEGGIAQIVQWRCLRDGDALRAERHHSTYVLSVVATGACCVHDGSWHATIDTVNALLHRPGATYRTSHPYGCIDSGWSIAYDRDVASDVLAHAGTPSWTRPTLVVATRPALLGLRQIVQIERGKCGGALDTVELEELALELLEAVATESMSGTGRGMGSRMNAEQHRVVEAARAYLNATYTRPLSLKHIARIVGASPAHLCRLFKKRVGITLREYLLRLRLNAALNAIADGECELAQAALRTGFCSQAHLTSVCTRLLGSPPGAVRRRCATPN